MTKTELTIGDILSIITAGVVFILFSPIFLIIWLMEKIGAIVVYRK